MNAAVFGGAHSENGFKKNLLFAFTFNTQSPNVPYVLCPVPFAKVKPSFDLATSPVVFLEIEISATCKENKGIYLSCVIFSVRCENNFHLKIVLI